MADHPVTLTDRQLVTLGNELKTGMPDASTGAAPYSTYSANDASACDELNAENRPHEVPVQLDSVLPEIAIVQGRDPMGLSEYLFSEDRLILIEARAQDNSHPDAQSAAVNTLAFLKDPADRDVMASNPTMQTILTRLGPVSGGGSGDLEQKHLDWVNNWGQRTISRMEEMRTPDGARMPFPCALVWVTEARKRVP